LSLWIQCVASGSNSQALFDFGATSYGGLEIAMNFGARTLSLDEDKGVLASSPQIWQTNKWYRLQVTWQVGGNIIGQLFDSDGVTLLNTVTHADNDFTAGGIAFTDLGGTYYFDSVSIDGLPNQGVSGSNLYAITLDSGATFQAQTATPGGAPG